MTDKAFIIQLVAGMAAAHACFSALELYSIRHRYDEGGIMSWKVVKLRVKKQLLAPVLVPVLARFRWVLLVRLVTGILLGAIVLYDPAQIAFAPLLFVLVLTDVAMTFRNTAGLSGAFHMSIVVNTGLLLATVFPDGSLGQKAAILFIATQGILGYLVAGIAKLRSAQWRSGLAILMVMSTRTWGNEFIFNLVRNRPYMNKAAAWLVIGFECLFPSVLFLDPPLIWALFSVAFLFHVSNAVVMGINSFLIIFPATYPAIYYANRYLQDLIPLGVLSVP